ncbi:MULTISPECIES: J domain-containing protein [Burkholderia cepacia complex]|uniref:J domain-containing protein n=1 Tax=Burkholderia cepacia complex TaxID=87882 RepID=UPI0009BF2D6C|nr:MULTISPECIES: J domain-containing protein [Burkholderia cepacia complex]
MKTKTHYDVLSVARDAPPEVVRAAYKALSQKWHPDKNPRAEAAEVMRAINVAYAVLSDATARTQYDRTLEEANAAWATNSPHRQSARSYSTEAESASHTSQRQSEPKPRRAFEVDWDAIERAQARQKHEYRVLSKDSLLAIGKTVGLLVAVLYVAHIIAASHG